MRLPGHRSDVLEVSVVMQDHSAVVLGGCRGEEIYHPCRSMMTPRGHVELDLAGPTDNVLIDWQYAKLLASPSGNAPDLGIVLAGISSFQVSSDARRGGSVGQQSVEDAGNLGVVSPRRDGCINQVEARR